MRYLVAMALVLGVTAPASAQISVVFPNIPACTDGQTLVFASGGTTIACGAATGSGTLTSTGLATGKVPKASGAQALVDSLLSESGSVVTVTGTLNATTAFQLNGTAQQNVASGTTPTFTGTNFTGIPISTGISGLGTGVATFLATPSSANLATAVTNETGSGALVFATSPTLTTPTLGVASATSLTLSGALSGVTSITASGKISTTGGGGAGAGISSASNGLYIQGGSDGVWWNNTADSLNLMQLSDLGELSIFQGSLYVAAGNIRLAATQKLYLDGGVDTFAWESAANTFDLVAGGTTMLSLTTTATFAGNTIVSSAARGNTAAGRSMQVGRNSTRGGAAGTVELIGLGGASNFIWADGSAAPGVLRIKATAPVEDNGTTSDRSGTVVGAQTSTLDTKDLIGDAMDPVDAFALLVATPVKRFTYKGDNAYGGTVFQGIIADWSPAFAMDPDEAHPNGRSFNAVSAFGVTVQAMKAIEARLAALEAEVTALRRQVIK